VVEVVGAAVELSGGTAVDIIGALFRVAAGTGFPFTPPGDCQTFCAEAVSVIE